jgi:hypothetical protein
LSDNNRELKNYVSEVRAEMKAENEKLVKKFEMESQKLQREILEKIELERTIFTNVVGQVQRETEQEVADMKRDFREFGSVIEAKLEQIIDDVTVVTDNISSKVTKVNEKISSKVTRVEVELNEKFEKLADKIDEKVNNKIQNVQVDDDNYTEENLKWQGERIEPLYVKNKELHSKLDEGINKSQVKKLL